MTPEGVYWAQMMFGWTLGPLFGIVFLIIVLTLIGNGWQRLRRAIGRPKSSATHDDQLDVRST